MKSIIGTILLVAAGTVLSNAATVVSGIPTDGLRYNWDFENGTNPVNGAGAPQGTWTDDFGYATGSGHGRVNGISGYKPSNKDLNLKANSFSISFDVANLTVSGTYMPLLTLYTNNGTGQDNRLSIETGESAALGFLFAKGFGDVNVGPGIPLGDVLRGSDWNTITITSDGATLSAYVNGTLIESFAGAADTAITGMKFGGRFDNPTGGEKLDTAFDIDNICIWDKALTAGQVEGLITGAVPEPSMFGLLAGLGALALAVSRRRRSRRG